MIYSGSTPEKGIPSVMRRETVENRSDSNNIPLWKKLGAGTAAALSLMLPSACTSDALPPAPGPTAVETTEQPKTQAEINQEIIDSYTIDMNIVPYDLLERFMKEMRLEHGSRPAEVHDVPEYWQEFQEPKERHDGMEMYELDVSRFDQFNINLKVLANILHVNRVNMGEEDYSDSNQQRIVKAAAQDVVGNMSLSPSEGEPDNNATKDVVVRAIRGFVQDVPADSVISNVEISLARVVPEDAEYSGTFANFTILHADGSEDSQEIMLSDRVPDLFQNLNEPTEPFDFEEAYYGSSVIGFRYNPDGTLLK